MFVFCISNKYGFCLHVLYIHLNLGSLAIESYFFLLQTNRVSKKVVTVFAEWKAHATLLY